MGAAGRAGFYPLRRAARAVIRLAGARSANGGEAVVLVVMHELGFPIPDPQVCLAYSANPSHVHSAGF